MTKNLGRADRALRVMGAGLAGLGALAAPYPLGLRLALGGGTAAYLLLTALGGTCLGYRLLGMSTCPARSRS